MEVKEGYKKTELGVIPNDWKIFKIKDIAQVLTGNTPPTIDKSNYGDDFLFVSPADLGKRKFIIKTEKGLSIKGFNISRKFPKNSILFTCIGSTIGKIGIAPKELTSNQQLNAIVPNSYYDTEYVYYSLDLLSPSIRASASEQAVPIINKSQFEQINITIPPTLKEQTAIATAISDVDALINSLEKIIVKKQAIKQGTMQLLLTGKKRLPGFSGEWEVKRLGDIGEFKNGINKGKFDFGFGYPFVNLMDVFGIPRISNNLHLGLINSNTVERKIYNLQKGDILFVRSSVKPDGVGLVSVITNDLLNTVFSGFLIRFRTINLNDHYKQYCFFEKGFRKKLIENSTISANTNINQESLKNLTMRIPPSKEEQTSIAEVLSALDLEIEALNIKVAKYRLIKQGMMQSLLTGKIRLV